MVIRWYSLSLVVDSDRNIRRTDFSMYENTKNILKNIIFTLKMLFFRMLDGQNVLFHKFGGQTVFFSKIIV